MFQKRIQSSGNFKLNNFNSSKQFQLQKQQKCFLLNQTKKYKISKNLRKQQQIKNCVSSLIDDKDIPEWKKKAAPKTKIQNDALQFLYDYGIDNGLILNQVQDHFPKVTQLNSFEIGSSIVKFKKAGISDNCINSSIIRFMPYALIPEKCDYLINYLKILEKYFGEKMDTCVQATIRDPNFNTLLFNKKQLSFNKKYFFTYDLNNFEKVVQSMLKYVEKQQRYFTLIFIFVEQWKLAFANPEEIEIHLKNLSEICDQCQKFYENEPYEKQFPQMKQLILYVSLQKMNYLILTEEQYQDAKKKMEFVHQIQGIITDMCIYFYYFQFDLESCIEPRYYFALLKDKLQFLKLKENDRYINIQLAKLCDYSDENFCKQLGEELEDFRKFKQYFLKINELWRKLRGLDGNQDYLLGNLGQLESLLDE
eukprot:TRINITY_DN9887_c0_g1_i4.p1 TRINITY_DN9887_c0_g1~~TRINITY_DN9887_c0_g1_i4.p1  ORF type:complete len:422 (-),score=38.83 TRINITY_DN9887_c0_g1_i4:136-1401(-)